MSVRKAADFPSEKGLRQFMKTANRPFHGQGDHDKYKQPNHRPSTEFPVGSAQKECDCGTQNMALEFN